MDDPGDYLAYMLRLWRVRSQGRTIWRASLESAHTGERVMFVDLDTLLAFIADKTRPPIIEESPQDLGDSAV